MMHEFIRSTEVCAVAFMISITLISPNTSIKKKIKQSIHLAKYYLWVDVIEKFRAMVLLILPTAEQVSETLHEVKNAQEQLSEQISETAYQSEHALPGSYPGMMKKLLK